MLFDRYPYTNFHELNLAYFITEFRNIFDQWAELYDTMTTWKDATDAELAAWKTQAEADMAAWEAATIADLNTWKTATQADISAWETATLTALDAWKSAFETLFNTTFSNLSQIKTDAEAARDAAIAAKNAAEAAQAAAEAAALTFVPDPTLSIPDRAADAYVTGQFRSSYNTMLDYTGDFDFSSAEKTGWTISGVNKWSHTVSGTARSVIFELGNIRKVKVTANSNAACAIAFLYDTTQAVGNTPDFADEYQGRITIDIGETQEFYIYPNMYYMYVLTTDTSNVDHTPTIELYYPLTDELLETSHIPADAAVVGELMNKILGFEEINTEPYPLWEWVLTYTSGGGEWRYQVPGQSRGKVIPIPKNVRRITVSAVNTMAVIACMKTCKPEQAETPDYSAGWVRTQIDYGTPLTFDVNPDCNYLYFTAITSNGNDIIPRIVFHYVADQDDQYTLEPVDSEVADETNVTDMSDAIYSKLAVYGECHLAKGIFYVSGITMPPNSKLIGSGADTIVKLIGTVEPGSAIKMDSACIVKDLTVKGLYTDLTPSSTDGSRHGIEWTGSNLIPGSIENCTIKNFDGAGIYLHDTSAYTYLCLSIVGCFLRYNHIGIDIRKNSEYNKITNCTIVNNYIGYRNRGGNNDISNSGVDANTIGMRIDNVEGSNNGHGIINGCTMNHSNAGNGYGLIISGTGRMMVSNCQIYYSKILLDDTNGNIINGCGFGTSAPIEITDGECSMFIGCIVRGWDSANTPVTITNNSVAKIINCFDRNGVAYS